MAQVEKTVDNLGRVVLPIKFRNQLGIKNNSKVFLFLEENAIRITPAKGICILCCKHSYENQEVRLCSICIERIKNIQ